MSPHLIRIWERRYDAVKPERTPTGRRFYSEADIERLMLLRRATLNGESISQVAGMTPDELRELVSSVVISPEPTDARDLVGAEQHLEFCLQAMKNLDAVGLETRLLRASVSLDQPAFLERLLHPLLELTGEMWSNGRLKVAHEHLASSVVRSLLGSMYISNSSRGAEPLLITSTPQGQAHEFGALMSSVTAASAGWRTLYLGPNLPAEEIAGAAAQRRADAIALSLVYPADDPQLSVELRLLRQLTNPRIKIIAGGRAAAAYSDVLDEIGAVRVSSLSDLSNELKQIRTEQRGPDMNHS